MLQIKKLFSASVSVAVLALVFGVAASFSTMVSAQETLNVYGPAGLRQR